MLTAIRTSWVAVGAVVGILGARLEIAGPEWLRVDGHAWVEMNPENKQAYLAGFLAGTAVGQALAAGAPDSAALVERVHSLVREGLAFPFAPNVYTARLGDYYFYEDRRVLPIWYAAWEVNHQLQHPPGRGP